MQIQILRQILAGILSTWLAVAPVAPVKLGASNPIPQAIGRFETTLASRISSSETSTATLVSGTTAAGNTLSGTYGFCIDCENSKWEYIVATANGTALTSITRGVSPDDGITSVSALKKEHLRGASVKITDAPSLPYIRNIVSGSSSLPSPLYYQTAITSPSSTALIDRAWLDATSTGFVHTTGVETIYGAKGFVNTISFSVPVLAASAPTLGSHLANKDYVDGVAIAGSPTMSTTIKGIAKLSKDPASSTNPIVWGANDDTLKQDFIYSNYTAGENITANDAVAMAHANNSILDQNISQYVGGTSLTNEYYYQSFTTPAGSPKLYGFKLYMGKGTGNCSANIFLNSTATTTNPILTCNNVSLSQNTSAWRGCVSSTGVSLTGSTTYYIIFPSSQVGCDNNSTINVATSNPYSGGVYASSSNSGATYTQHSAIDSEFAVFYLSGTGGKVYKAGAGAYVDTSGNAVLTVDDARTNFIGIASSTTAIGGTVPVKIAGLAKGYSGLTATGLTPSLYYMPNFNATSTAGVPTSTASSYTKVIGRAISTTTILINSSMFSHSH